MVECLLCPYLVHFHSLSFIGRFSPIALRPLVNQPRKLAWELALKKEKKREPNIFILSPSTYSDRKAIRLISAFKKDHQQLRPTKY